MHNVNSRLFTRRKKSTKRLAETITAKGITATATEKYKDLVDKVAQIENLKGEERTLENFTNVLSEPKSIVQLEYPNNTSKTLNAKLGNKNLIPYPYTDTTKTLNGITFTVNSDGSVTVSGTATAQAYFKLQQSFSLKKGQYFFSGCPKGGAGTTYSLYLSTSDYVFYKADIGNGISINSEDDKTVSIVINIANGTTVDNLVFKPQLELGNKATDYVPYVSDFTTVTVTRYGTTEADRPQTYTPTASGEVIGITNLYPTTTLLTDNAGVVFEQVTGGFYKEILPSADKNGITKVYQPSVDSTIDSNITSDNIKQGVNILGVTGDYICNYTYDETTKELVLIL